MNHQRWWVQLMVARELLIVSALLETATGLALLLSPPLVAAVLLGASLDAPAALVVGRVGDATTEPRPIVMPTIADSKAWPHIWPRSGKLASSFGGGG